MAMSSGSHASEIALNDAKNTENETEDDKNSLPPILPVTELDDEWNPMLEDYKDPNFNHYTSGPEKYKPASKVQAPWTNKSRPGMEEYGELYRVFINRIPFQINETGLESLCTKISCKPVKLYLRAKEYFMNTDKRTAWAIVEYAKHSDAEKLIIGLNRTPPLHLEAKFGLTDAEKEKLAKEKEEKRKFEEMSQASSRMSIEQMIEQSKTNPPNYKLLGIGRGLPVSPLYQQVSYTRKPDPGALILHGRPDLNLRPRHEPFNYSDEVDYFGQYAGGYNDDSMSVISNSMEEMQLRKPYVTPAGNRRQSYGGRGYNMANRRDNGRVPGNRHGGRGLHHNGFSSRNNFGPDDSPRPGTSKDEDGCASQVLATENGGYGSCINCKIVTVLMCSKCGARICGDVCHKQLQIHPHSCTPMGNGQVDRRWMQAVPTSTNRNPHQFAARNYHQQRGNKGAQSNNDKENYGDISQLNKLGLRQESQNKSELVPPYNLHEPPPNYGARSNPSLSSVITSLNNYCPPSNISKSSIQAINNISIPCNNDNTSNGTNINNTSLGAIPKNTNQVVNCTSEVEVQNETKNSDSGPNISSMLQTTDPNVNTHVQTGPTVSSLSQQNGQPLLQQNSSNIDPQNSPPVQQSGPKISPTSQPNSIPVQQNGQQTSPPSVQQQNGQQITPPSVNQQNGKQITPPSIQQQNGSNNTAVPKISTDIPVLKISETVARLPSQNPTNYINQSRRNQYSANHSYNGRNESQKITRFQNNSSLPKRDIQNSNNKITPVNSNIQQISTQTINPVEKKPTEIKPEFVMKPVFSKPPMIKRKSNNNNNIPPFIPPPFSYPNNAMGEVPVNVPITGDIRQRMNKEHFGKYHWKGTVNGENVNQQQKPQSNEIETSESTKPEEECKNPEETVSEVTEEFIEVFTPEEKSIAEDKENSVDPQVIKILNMLHEEQMRASRSNSASPTEEISVEKPAVESLPQEIIVTTETVQVTEEQIPEVAPPTERPEDLVEQPHNKLIISPDKPIEDKTQPQNVETKEEKFTPNIPPRLQPTSRVNSPTYNHESRFRSKPRFNRPKPLPNLYIPKHHHQPTIPSLLSLPYQNNIIYPPRMNEMLMPIQNQQQSVINPSPALVYNQQGYPQTVMYTGQPVFYPTPPPIPQPLPPQNHVMYQPVSNNTYQLNNQYVYNNTYQPEQVYQPNYPPQSPLNNQIYSIEDEPEEMAPTNPVMVPTNITNPLTVMINNEETCYENNGTVYYNTENYPSYTTPEDCSYDNGTNYLQESSEGSYTGVSNSPDMTPQIVMVPMNPNDNPSAMYQPVILVPMQQFANNTQEVNNTTQVYAPITSAMQQQQQMPIVQQQQVPMLPQVPNVGYLNMAVNYAYPPPNITTNQIQYGPVEIMKNINNNNNRSVY